jgi:hypothetical protein
MAHHNAATSYDQEKSHVTLILVKVKYQAPVISHDTSVEQLYYKNNKCKKWHYFLVVCDIKLTLLGSSKAGLANFNTLEGHTIRKDLSKGCTCVYMYRKVPGRGKK